MDKNYSKLGKETYVAPQSPGDLNKINLKKPTPIHIKIKLSKVKDRRE